MAPHDRDTDEAARIRERLARLAAERDALEAPLAELDPKAPAETDGSPHAATVTPEHRRADPPAIVIDAVNDDRIRPDWSFPDGSWRGLVPCFAIRGHEPAQAEHPRRRCAQM